jgi:hypothetical protein
VKVMGKGGREKTWPKSWKQTAILGGTVTLKARGFEKDLVVLPLTVAAKTPAELAEGVDEAVVAETLKRPPS